MNLKKQIRRLLLVSAISSFQLAGASWVALLAVRGFSMVEIGLAEACFHAASLALKFRPEPSQMRSAAANPFKSAC